MTKEQKVQALALRAAGNTYFQIATMLSVPKNTVKSFCQRHPQEIIHIKEEPILDDTHGTTSFCRKCGKPLIQKPGRKPMVFCSSECRVTWWNQHPEKVNQKAIYHFTCACCGKPFDSYGNAKREYCSHACYIKDRFYGGGSDDQK